MCVEQPRPLTYFLFINFFKLKMFKFINKLLLSLIKYVFPDDD